MLVDTHSGEAPHSCLRGAPPPPADARACQPPLQTQEAVALWKTWGGAEQLQDVLPWWQVCLHRVCVREHEDSRCKPGQGPRASGEHEEAKGRSAVASRGLGAPLKSPRRTRSFRRLQQGGCRRGKAGHPSGKPQGLETDLAVSGG